MFFSSSLPLISLFLHLSFVVALLLPFILLSCTFFTFSLLFSSSFYLSPFLISLHTHVSLAHVYPSVRTAIFSAWKQYVTMCIAERTLDPLDSSIDPDMDPHLGPTPIPLPAPLPVPSSVSLLVPTASRKKGAVLSDPNCDYIKPTPKITDLKSTPRITEVEDQR